MNDALRRLVARLLPKRDDVQRDARAEDVLREADLTLARHEVRRRAVMENYRRIAERHRR